jgi:hypothetical protein
LEFVAVLFNEKQENWLILFKSKKLIFYLLLRAQVLMKKQIMI